MSHAGFLLGGGCPPQGQLPTRLERAPSFAYPTPLVDRSGVGWLVGLLAGWPLAFPVMKHGPLCAVVSLCCTGRVYPSWWCPPSPQQECRGWLIPSSPCCWPRQDRFCCSRRVFRFSLSRGARSAHLPIAFVWVCVGGQTQNPRASQPAVRLEKFL